MNSSVGRGPFRPEKSWRLSIHKGRRSDNIFSVKGEKIPLLAEQPVRSLGRVYIADLSDKHTACSAMARLSKGKKIYRSHVPGKFKACSLLLPDHLVMQPLKVSEISLMAVRKIDSKANNYIHKWLGLLQCLSTAGLFGRNTFLRPGIQAES